VKCLVSALAIGTCHWTNRLAGKGHSGQAKVTEEELAWLVKNIREHFPQQFKFEFRLSTVSLIGSHPVHKSAVAKRFIAEQNGRLKLFFLPYSPH